jgi:thioredoxin-related protein
MRKLNVIGMAALLGAAVSIGSALAAAELVMVEQAGCHWCARWNAEIAHIYPKTEEGARAPLRRVDLRDLRDDIDFTSKPVFTPTFVLVDNGRELGRIEGYAGDQFFWFLLKELLDAHPDRTMVMQ